VHLELTQLSRRRLHLLLRLPLQLLARIALSSDLLLEPSVVLLMLRLFSAHRVGAVGHEHTSKSEGHFDACIALVSRAWALMFGRV